MKFLGIFLYLIKDLKSTPFSDCDLVPKENSPNLWKDTYLELYSDVTQAISAQLADWTIMRLVSVLLFSMNFNFLLLVENI